MSEDGGYLGSLALVRGLRPRWLLIFVEKQARHETLPRHRPSDRQVPRARRGLDVLLHRRRDVRGRLRRFSLPLGGRAGWGPLGGEGAFRFGRLDLDYFAKPVDGFDGVVEGDCAVGWNEVCDLQVVAPALEPGKRRHTEHATPHRLRVLLGERREIRRLDVLLPARDVQSGALGHDAMGRMLIEGQMVFVAGALEGEPEAITELVAPGPGGGRCPNRR